MRRVAVGLSRNLRASAIPCGVAGTSMMSDCAGTFGAGCLKALSASHPRAADFLSSLSAQATDVPSQLHLAIGAADHELMLTWTTKNECPHSRVWLTREHQPAQDVAATTYTYTVPDMWWQPKTMKWIHSATLTGLFGREVFEYKVGDNVTEGCQVLEVPVEAKAPPSRGDLPISMALMADVGSIELLGFAMWRALDQRSRLGDSLDTDLAVHAGDVSYAGMDSAIPFLNVSKYDEWEPLWDVYGLAHQNYTQRRAYQLGIGNHEAWYNWTATTHRYPTAQSDVPAVSGAAPPFWYTFVAGGVHWTMLSTEHDYSPGSVQYTFLDAALAAVDRKVTPWSAVAFHRPMYSSDKSEYGAHIPGCSIQVHLEPLMLRHKVDLVFTGHQHAYERVHPNIAGNVTSMPTPLAGLVDPFGANTAYVRPGAPVHILGGNGGAVQDFSWVDPAPSWSAVRLSSGCDSSGGRHCIPEPRNLLTTYGYVHAEFFNRTHARLHTEMVTKGQPHDGFWIIRADGA
jgi:hypothetical protein